METRSSPLPPSALENSRPKPSESIACRLKRGSANSPGGSATGARSRARARRWAALAARVPPEGAGISAAPLSPVRAPSPSPSPRPLRTALRSSAALSTSRTSTPLLSAKSPISFARRSPPPARKSKSAIGTKTAATPIRSGSLTASCGCVALVALKSSASKSTTERCDTSKRASVSTFASILIELAPPTEAAGGSARSFRSQSAWESTVE
mmetsp:Transcript_32316/g.80451  ORF Transcript_32316/g.80451 Transcript_32316/m.80451 type:complete len:211 (+) Transcript_32316:159-791(+)